MKIAVSGKGGVGKTTFSGTMARIFSSRGYRIIAIDSDPSMNMHSSIGVDNPLPISEYKELIKKRTVLSSGVYNLKPKVDDILDRYSSQKENIKLIVMGTVKKGGSGCICPESAFLRALLRHLVLKKGEFLILDTEAGLEHLGRSIADKFDLMIILVEPSSKAIETANKIYQLSKQIGIKKIIAIGNKVQSGSQEKFISKEINFEALDFIPYDEGVVEADMQDRPLIDLKPYTIAMKKIEEISSRIIEMAGIK